MPQASASWLPCPQSPEESMCRVSRRFGLPTGHRNLATTAICLFAGAVLWGGRTMLLSGVASEVAVSPQAARLAGGRAVAMLDAQPSAAGASGGTLDWSPMGSPSATQAASPQEIQAKAKSLEIGALELGAPPGSSAAVEVALRKANEAVDRAADAAAKRSRETAALQAFQAAKQAAEEAEITAKYAAEVAAQAAQEAEIVVSGSTQAPASVGGASDGSAVAAAVEPDAPASDLEREQAQGCELLEGDDCLRSRCCIGDGMHCFARDAEKAECLSSCFPGVHFEDATPQKPWSCDPLQPLKPTFAFCSDAGANCRNTRCCKDSSSSCYQKNKYFATCLPSCTPGVRLADPVGMHEPWTCEALHPRTPPGVLRQVRQPTLYLSIFCWSIMRTVKADNGISELDLIYAQYPLAAGIFGCDEYTLFSDKALDDIPFTQTISSLQGRNNVPGALTATWVNADDFIEAWDRIIKDGRYRNHDWIVKADPDAVFLPNAMKQVLEKFENLEGTEQGFYLKNCEAGPRNLQLFGSIELLTHDAVSTLGDNRELCRTIDHGLMGEDLWLQLCLDKIGVRPLQDYEFLSDGYCPSAKLNATCGPPSVAFHPFKMPDQWLKCWEDATSRTIYTQ
mmetsp:Transcript_11558/g.41222  ORF Transcript_11558/g.41222 Transcript_11558/m.41222 type:complete len:623 (+) Transcript_11558:74-1942(+)